MKSTGLDDIEERLLGTGVENITVKEDAVIEHLMISLFFAEHLLNVSVSNQGRSNSLTLTWDRLLPEVQGFSLALHDLETGTLLQKESAGPNATSFDFQDLLPGTQYEVEVTALLACARNSSRKVTGRTGMWERVGQLFCMGSF